MDLPRRQAPIVAFEITVNGALRQVAVDVRTTLLDLLREHLGLPGTKRGV